MAAEEGATARDHEIELPAPTAWPLIAAFGLAFMLFGLVTNGLVSIVGVVAALAGAVGWWRDVLPREQEERVLIRAAAPVRPAGRIVEHLRPGERGHRARLPVEVYPYTAGIRGGIAGAVAMATVALVYGLAAQGSPWYPINLLAAVAMPSLAQASPEQLNAFNGAAFGVALIAHGVISIFVGLLYAVTLPMMPRHPLVAGGLLAPLVWTGLLWASLGVVNPTLNARIDWFWFVLSQVAFGLAAGAVVARVEKVKTLQTASLSERAGIEVAGE